MAPFGDGLVALGHGQMAHAGIDHGQDGVAGRIAAQGGDAFGPPFQADLGQVQAKFAQLAFGIRVHAAIYRI